MVQLLIVVRGVADSPQDLHAQHSILVHVVSFDPFGHSSTFFHPRHPSFLTISSPRNSSLSRTTLVILPLPALFIFATPLQSFHPFPSLFISILYNIVPRQTQLIDSTFSSIVRHKMQPSISILSVLFSSSIPIEPPQGVKILTHHSSSAHIIMPMFFGGFPTKSSTPTGNPVRHWLTCSVAASETGSM